MRITTDTNILWRGHQNASGPARQLLGEIIGGDHELVLSQQILYQLEEVLTDPRAREITKLSLQEISAYIEHLTGACTLDDHPRCD